MNATKPQSVRSGDEGVVPNELHMIGALWPILLASAVGLVPFTVFSTFLVPIAHDANTSVAVMGGLRGLGGFAALLVGTVLAPLIDRLPKVWVAAGGLLLLGVSSVLGSLGEQATLAAFCLLVGASTALLNPALTTAAADRYGTGAAAGRAATLLTATQSLTAMLAAPVISLPAMLWGWQGDLVAVAVVSLLLAVVLLVRKHPSKPPSEQISQPGYLATFRALAAVRGVAVLLLIAFLRTAAFMGYLSYLAAFYHQRFALSPELFALVWTLSGTSFFLGNLLIGRRINSVGSTESAQRYMIFTLFASLTSIVMFYYSSTLPMALMCTAVFAASHASVAACVTTLLVRSCGELRGSAMSINAAGMSFGVFVGATVGGLGLGFAGYPGVALGLGGLNAIALVAAVALSRRGGPAADRNERAES